MGLVDYGCLDLTSPHVHSTNSRVIWFGTLITLILVDLKVTFASTFEGLLETGVVVQLEKFDSKVIYLHSCKKLANMDNMYNYT